MNFYSLTLFLLLSIWCHLLFLLSLSLPDTWKLSIFSPLRNTQHMLRLEPFNGPKSGEYEKASYILIDCAGSKCLINQHLLSSQMEMQVKLWPSLDPVLLKMVRWYRTSRMKLLSTTN